MTADAELDPEELVSALTGDEDGRRLLAIEALQDCDRRGPLDDALVSALLVCLGHRRRTIQRTAAEVLARWASVTPEIQPRLLRLLGASDFHSRWEAAFTLAKIGPAPAMLPVLIETLGQSDSDLRWAAESILVELARRSRETRDALVELAGAGSPVQRKMAIYGLRDLDDPDEGFCEVLVAQLKFPDSGVRLAALAALVRLFARSPEVLQAVAVVAQQDPDGGVKRAAVNALELLSAEPPGSDSEGRGS